MNSISTIETNEPLVLAFTCERCRQSKVGEPNTIALVGLKGDSASGYWCDDCWPSILQRLGSLLSAVADA